MNSWWQGEKSDIKKEKGKQLTVAAVAGTSWSHERAQGRVAHGVRWPEGGAEASGRGAYGRTV